MLKSVTEAPIAAAAAATAFSISSHTAISFATVASQNNTDQHYDVERINAFAALIEKFCRLNLPEAFEVERQP